MNILHTYTRRALRKNRMRTLVTIIGIVLSMALLTAVIEGAYSGLVYLRGVITEDTGNWHALYPELDRETADRVREQDFVRDVVTTWQTVGYEALDEDADRLPLFVDTLIGDAPLIEERLIAGRMPENDRELIVSSYFYDLLKTGDLAAFEIGQTVTLPIGTRTAPTGEPLTENDPLWEDETVTDATERTYTIVGVYKSFDPSVGGTGYRALTKGEGTGTCAVFLTVRHPYFFKFIMGNQTVSENWRSNSSLMRLYGVFSNDVLIMVFYGFAAVLVLLVMFGSISLIYNAFSISVAERTRQFGILKSIGATKKQIRASVRYEALLLSAVGIPIGLFFGCAGIGITLFAIRDTFTKLMPNAVTQMRLVLHPIALLLAALIALVTVLISAAVPARRAARLQPIDAIRSSADVKTKATEVRTLKLTETLFGFEGTMGAKNFKRNRKGYRATVLSLIMSVVLFISASSFCTYLTDMVRTVSDDSDVDVFAYLPTDAADALLPKLEQIEGVTRFAYYRAVDAGTAGYTADAALLTDAFLGVPGNGVQAEDGRVPVNAAVLYLDDDTFRALCKSSGVDPAPYFSDDCAYGVLCNTDITEAVRGEGNRFKYYRYDLFRANALPAAVFGKEIAEREGMIWHYDYSGEEERIAYYPEEYIKEQMAQGGAYGRYNYSLDPKRATEIVPIEEALEPVTYAFNAFVKGDGFCISSECAVLLYPISKLPEKMKDDVEQITVLFRAVDHKAVRTAVLKLFTDAELQYNAYAGDVAEERENSRLIVGVVNVFAYGFIILISLIAAANVFNTISTSIMLRRREFAMLKSIGMTDKGLRKMLSYECIIYGLRALLFGLPASVLVTFLIHRIVSAELERSFYMPWHSIVIAVGSVFLVVFATMLYARRKLKRDNPIDTLKNENL